MSPADSLAGARLKQEIVDCCRRSVQYGLNFNTQRNISVRVPGAGSRASGGRLTAVTRNYPQTAR